MICSVAHSRFEKCGSCAGGATLASARLADCARETVASLWDEIQPLLRRHAAEVAHYKDIPLSPDKDIYLKMEAIGAARVFTLRQPCGLPECGGRGHKLIGYSIFFVRRAMHYDSLQAQNDIIFIAPEHRGVGAAFIKWCDDQLRQEGVQVVTHHVKAAHNWGKVVERQGYELVDLVYAKRLDR